MMTKFLIASIALTALCSVAGAAECPSLVGTYAMGVDANNTPAWQVDVKQLSPQMFQIDWHGTEPGELMDSWTVVSNGTTRVAMKPNTGCAVYQTFEFANCGLQGTLEYDCAASPVKTYPGFFYHKDEQGNFVETYPPSIWFPRDVVYPPYRQ
jgi:hypothetical protein